MFARLEVRDALVARTRLGTAAIQARTDGRTLSLKLGIAERVGKLDGDLQTSVNWQGVVPSIDDTHPISAHLEATNVDAVLLSPLVRDVLSEIGGQLDAHLSATLTPNPDPKAEQHWSLALGGPLSMQNGTLQLARLALRMKNVSWSARAAEHGTATLITVDSLSAAAEAEQRNVTASGSITLEGFRVVKGNALVRLHGVPLLIEGVTMATLDSGNFSRECPSGSAQRDCISVELERRPTEMFVNLTIPQLNAVIPQSAARDLIALGSNPNIEVAQPIAEPRRSGDGEALPWRMKFNLGNNVKLSRTDLFLPITGAPEILLGDELKANGNVELIPGGRLSLFGVPRPFTIEGGTVSFDPEGDPGDPRLSVQAICETPQVTVRAKVSGTLSKPNIDSLEDVNDPSTRDQGVIIGRLLNNTSDESKASSAGSATGLDVGAGLVGRQLLANTPLSNLQIKAGSETTADQSSYQTYSAAYPISDKVWFEGSYKTLQGDPSTASTTNAFSGTIDWRFRRNWSMRTELGNIGGGVDLLWQYKY
jgi:hypothetical protein